ncbi:hypothetical protein [Bacillus weihaiensis]|uniref:Uncharacterized protein n=1 Tax=Bacillus weihaiensis TaxID=1547283 RepID=A0A1L3MNM8_9BACI|nr:hypothetical protein [Bacillus weihaiensis]APH03958.1 hypothetical protein A9C19_03820 [Bacillus weihaiensis]
MGIKKLFTFKNLMTTPYKKEELNANHYGGIVHQLKLEEFWSELDSNERGFIRSCAKRSYGGRIQPQDLDDRNSTLKTKRKDYEFLLGNVSWAYQEGRYGLVEKLLKEILLRTDIPYVCHRAYKVLVQLYNEWSTHNQSYFNQCIEYCYKHIELAPTLYKQAIVEGKEPPSIEAFGILKQHYLDVGNVSEHEVIVLLENRYLHLD